MRLKHYVFSEPGYGKSAELDGLFALAKRQVRSKLRSGIFPSIRTSAELYEALCAVDLPDLEVQFIDVKNDALAAFCEANVSNNWKEAKGNVWKAAKTTTSRNSRAPVRTAITDISSFSVFTYGAAKITRMPTSPRRINESRAIATAASAAITTSTMNRNVWQQVDLQEAASSAASHDSFQATHEMQVDVDGYVSGFSALQSGSLCRRSRLQGTCYWGDEALYSDASRSRDQSQEIELAMQQLVLSIGDDDDDDGDIDGDQGAEDNAAAARSEAKRPEDRPLPDLNSTMTLAEFAVTCAVHLLQSDARFKTEVNDADRECIDRVANVERCLPAGAYLATYITPRMDLRCEEILGEIFYESTVDKSTRRSADDVLDILRRQHPLVPRPQRNQINAYFSRLYRKASSSSSNASKATTPRTCGEDSSMNTPQSAALAADTMHHLIDVEQQEERPSVLTTAPCRSYQAPAAVLACAPTPAMLQDQKTTQKSSQQLPTPRIEDQDCNGNSGDVPMTPRRSVAYDSLADEHRSKRKTSDDSASERYGRKKRARSISK